MTILNELLGYTIIEIDGAYEESEVITFTMSEGRKFVFWHDQDCCESVTVNDVCGNVLDLIGAPLLVADEYTNDGKLEYGDSFTWTFYKFATIKGSVTIRWYGTSNGYCSESVNYGWSHP